MKKYLPIIASIIILIGCNESNKKSNIKPSTPITKKVEYETTIYDSIDSTFVLKGDKMNLKCRTEFLKDYSIADTVNDTLINLYSNRLFKFSLHNSLIDTQFVVSKELFKSEYKFPKRFLIYIIVHPRIESVDTINNKILIKAAFLYPPRYVGTDVFDDVFFEITPKGKVVFQKVVLQEDYEQ